MTASGAAKVSASRAPITKRSIFASLITETRTLSALRNQIMAGKVAHRIYVYRV